MLKKLLLLLLVVSLGSSVLVADDNETGGNDGNPPQVREGENESEDIVDDHTGDEREDGGSRAFEVLDLSDEELRVIAQNIFNLMKSISEEYYISDGLTLTTYILRYMAEIGEYELAYKELMALVKGFENLQGKEFDEEIYVVLEQIRKIKFGTRNGKYFAKFFSKSEKGIRYDIFQKNEEDEDSSLTEIKYLVIEDGAEFYFDEVDKPKEKQELVKWVKKEYKFKLFGKYMFHEDIPKYINGYFDLETPANAMKVEYKDVWVKVGTSTFFKDMKLKFKDGYVLPGFRKGEKPIPSFLLRLQAKLVKVKTSVDQ